MPHRTLGVIALAALAFGCGPRRPAELEGQGSLELPEIDLSPTVPARVVQFRVEEGDSVQAGDTLVLLTQTDLPASLAGQRARLSMATANLQDLEAGARPEELARGEAELRTAQAEAVRTATELERTRGLFRGNVVSRQQLDQAEAAAQMAAGRRDAAEEALRLLRAGSRADRIAAARAEVASARASLAALEARVSDLVLVAPVRGVVLSRNAEPGELLGAGAPALTVGDASRPFVRIYLAQRVVGRVRVGQPADIHLVGDDSRSWHGRVEAVNSRAEFTPRVALTEEERADLLFGVKVGVTTDGGPFHPGLWVAVRLVADSAS
jgi:membrane fusion protein YbhG